MRWTDEEIEKLKNEYPWRTKDELEDLFDRDGRAIRKKAQRLGVTKDINHSGRAAIRNSDIKTPEFINEGFNQFIAGFVAGEGCFSKSNDKNRKLDRYRFHIEVSQKDRRVLEKIKDYFGVGKIYDFEAREKNWDATSMYSVQKLGAITNVIIPFFEKTDLRSTNKEIQYNQWKKEFIDTYDLDE